MKRFYLLSLMLLLLAACQPNFAVVTVTPPGQEPAAINTPAPAENAAAPLPVERGEFFATSGQCAVCHTRMTDEAGNDVSLDSQWRTSMMGNAARDPYWQAGVRNEILSNPDYAEFIQDKCATCHMPMARFTLHEREENAQVLDDGLADADHPLHTLAYDGVSCTVCHQIEGDTLGTEESFSGHYPIDTTRPMGERAAYGPFDVSEANQIVMQGSSGFIPTQADYVRDSELCGACHTLYTPTLDYNGEIVGEFAEQMVYPEWLNSAYRDTQSCADCHMPPAEGSVVLSITGSEPREPFMQHIFVGANFYMPDLLRRHRNELGTTGGDDQFDFTIAQVMDQLQNHTATLTIDDVQRDGDTLIADLTITSQTGHKLPTSYPARRVWLHVTVTDSAGNVVFESGAFNVDGSIVGNDNDADPARYEPHYTEITAPDEVQIYEAVMGDVSGQPTTTLLFGAGYLKDNRLLPDGFDKDSAHEDYGVWGLARNDTDFVGGSDRIRYRVDVSAADSPLTVTAELRYQSIGYRWAHNLERHDSPETNRFLAYYNETPSPAVTIASAAATLP